MTEQSDAAFFSGMTMGWIHRLEQAYLHNNSKETLDLIQDMKDESERLAKFAGVKLDE